MADKPQSNAQRKLRSAASVAGQHLSPPLPPVWFLTDPARTPFPEHVAAQLPAGWGIIYRHFGKVDRRDEAQSLANIARTRHLKFLIAADPQLAKAVKADGVHWPHSQIMRAKRWRSQFSIMTTSAHSALELRRAASFGLDAALVSTVFESNSPSASKPIGPAKLRLRARSVNIPIYALGGMHAQNAMQIAKTSGIASIEGILDAYGPKVT